MTCARSTPYQCALVNAKFKATLVYISPTADCMHGDKYFSVCCASRLSTLAFSSVANTKLVSMVHNIAANTFRRSDHYGSHYLVAVNSSVVCVFMWCTSQSFLYYSIALFLYVTF